ncbi:MAG: pantoate--beta-alanine ligase [Legionella sp.]|jgi:pantoate--beta-alanine ligase|nr:pantoate--beta-alanine ligase [Legionella sp.]
MQIFEHALADWRATRAALPKTSSLGLVTTMGNLHAGHLSLVKQSQQDNDKTAVTLFVNPTQFNHPDDFTHYPRTIDADIAYLEQAGVDYCLIPSPEHMYADNYRYQLEEKHESLIMEGKHRPGHFTGVLTIVMKLFNLIKPTRAYFGEKDYQQLSLIQGMVDAFLLDIEIKACPIIREPSGLAYSSRNTRLSPKGRKTAEAFARIFHQATSCEDAIHLLKNIDIKLDYIEEHDDRRFAAVFVENIRLIDNYALDKNILK